MTTATQTITINDLLRLGADARVEVVEGEIIEMTPVGGRHVFIVDNIYRMLYPSVSQNKSGYVFTDNLLYRLSGHDDDVRLARAPDVSFIHHDHIVRDWDVDRPYPGAPTLAVEVMSPDDKFEEVTQKVQDYLDAGSVEVWVVLPRQETVYRYRQGESHTQIYRRAETLDASALLPGLALALADIFRLPELD